MEALSTNFTLAMLLASGVGTYVVAFLLSLVGQTTASVCTLLVGIPLFALTLLVTNHVTAGVLAAFAGAVVIEITLLNTNTFLRLRPSALIGGTGRTIRWFLFKLYAALCLLTDLGRFIKQIALLIRDLFFRFVPRDIIVKAMDDLWTSMGVLARSPYGAVEGVIESLKHVRVPCLSVSLLLLINVMTFIAVPVIAEVALLVLEFETRPSTIMATLGFWTFRMVRDLFFGLRFAWDWSAAIVAFVGSFFAWIDPELVKNATKTLQHVSAHAITSAPRGALMGACLLFSNQDACGHYLVETVDRVVLPITLVVVGLIFVWWIQHVSGFWFLSQWRAMIEAYDNGGGGGGGGGRRRPPAPPRNQGNDDDDNGDEDTGAGIKPQTVPSIATTRSRRRDD